MQIYKIINCLNSKIYIGKDTSSDPNYYGSGVIINRAIKKYGIENFTKEIIDTAEAKADLAEKEKYWISFYNSTDKEIGYNISKGGDGGDTISNNPNRDIITKKLSETSPTKGKTYEEVYGSEKALSYKKRLSESHKYRTPRPKKEKTVKEDRRKTRWEGYHENKNKNFDSIFQNVLEKIRKSDIISNIEEIDDLKENRSKLGISFINDFYKKFCEFEKEIVEYYEKKEYDNRSRSHTGRLHTELGKDKIRLSKIEISRSYFQELVKIIDDNNIEELEDYFTEYDSINIRKRFLDGSIKDEVPEKYKNIIRKKRTKTPIWSDKSKKSFEKKIGKEIEIDGIKYDSISGAAREIGVDRNWIRHKLSTGKWPAKFINKK
jgi:hypothetical protein